MSKRTFKPQAHNEGAHARERRKAAGWYDRYLIGTGIDIGAGDDPIVPHARVWDIANGDPDAHALPGIDPDSVDFVYASHVLEHMRQPRAALAEWYRVIRPGGYLLLAVPEEDSYERGLWPSLQNSDHRSTWSAHKDDSWSPNSNNVLDLLAPLEWHKLLSIQIVQDHPEYSQVEAVIQKSPKQPVWQNTIAGKVVCPCGSNSMRLVGMNIMKKVVAECMSCGQTVNIGLEQIAENVDKALDILRGDDGS